jgi:hypothetical protein
MTAGNDADESAARSGRIGGQANPRGHQRESHRRRIDSRDLRECSTVKAYNAKTKMPKADAPSAGDSSATCELLYSSVAVVSLAAQAALRTRLLSWLESALCGTHPRTKGVRCFAGEQPAAITADPRGLLTGRAGQHVKRPLKRNEST